MDGIVVTVFIERLPQSWKFEGEGIERNFVQFDLTTGFRQRMRVA